MSALKKGDRVRMTAAAIAQRLEGPRQRKTGIVTGILPDGRLRVHRTHLQRAEAYHPSFWELAP